MERVSSGSFVINDSAKLSQIYYKREEQLKHTELKLSLEPLITNNGTPNNLCAYLDFGFSAVYSEPTSLQNDIMKFDFQPVCDFLNSNGVQHSISRLGTSFLISYGEISTNSNLINAGLHNFIEIMYDGSVKGRIILFSMGKQPQTMVDIYSLLRVTEVFEKVYSLIFDESHFKTFVYALKYERLTVLKQFTPIYDFANTEDCKRFTRYLSAHIKKYGSNLIMSSGRYPYVGFKTIDKKYFNDIKEKYNYENLLCKLFPTAFATIGYIDRM